MLITYRQANCFNVKGRTVKEFTNGNKKKKDYDSGMADQFPVIAVSEDTLFNKTGARVTGQKKKKGSVDPGQWKHDGCSYLSFRETSVAVGKCFFDSFFF